MYELLEGDCLNVLKGLPDNSADLICTDPPYFKVKTDWWDNQWSKPGQFLEWLDSIAEQWQRILKPNGSLYCFASPKMSARVEVMLGERFNIVNRITWIKCGNNTPGWHRRTSKETLRGFFPITESIIFCEHYGDDNAAKGVRGSVFEPLIAYLNGERIGAGATLKECNLAYGSRMAGHYFNTVQFCLPTAPNYTKLQQAFPGYFTRSYESLQQQYESLQQQYESLRRPFSVTDDVPYTDVWSFPPVHSYSGKHPCEKPAALLEHIITTSSRPGAVVLDCFAGSGSTLVAAQKLGRESIGIEIDPHWVNFAKARLENTSIPLTPPPKHKPPKPNEGQLELF